MPLPAERDRHVGDRVVTADLHVRTAGASGRWRAPGARAAPIADPTCGARHVTRLHDHVRRLTAPPGNAASMRLSVLTIGSPLGRPWRPGVRGVDAERGDRQRDHHPAGQHRRRSGVPQHAVDDRAPDPRLAAALAALARRTAREPFITLSPSLDSRAGKHGQRPEHRDRDHQDRARRHRGERLVAGQVHPGHRGHHGQAGDHEHRAARGRRRGLQRGLLAASGSSLLPLAAHVEQRVVDADRHPDQQHHLGHRRVDRARCG